MKITKSKVKNLVATITINLIEEDYIANVDNVINDYKKTVVIPGFRKGKTPIAIINKKYRRPVMIEEVSKVLQNELYKYITENKINILGSPLPLNEDKIDWDSKKDFSFKYEIGLSPDFDIKITNKNKLEYFKINIDANLIKKYCDDIAKRYGNMKESDKSIEGDLIFCKIEQLDDKGAIIEKGVSNEATVSMDYISDKKIKNKFIGVKLNDSIKINVKKAFLNSSDLSAMLNISNNELTLLKSDSFLFTIKKINQLKPAKIDQDLFDKVYGKNSISSIKEFKNKIKKEAENQFLVESDRMFKNDVVYYLLDKLKLSMPDEFLKRWLLQTSKQPITEELLEKEYSVYSKGLQWQLIENKILAENNIKVSNDDVIDHAKQLVVQQMKQYGQNELENEQLLSIVDNILKNEDEKKKIYDQIYDKRTLEFYKNNFKLIEKMISYDDFVKLASEKNK